MSSLFDLQKERGKVFRCTSWVNIQEIMEKPAHTMGRYKGVNEKIQVVFDLHDEFMSLCMGDKVGIGWMFYGDENNYDDIKEKLVCVDKDVVMTGHVLSIKKGMSTTQNDTTQEDNDLIRIDISFHGALLSFTSKPLPFMVEKNMFVAVYFKKLQG